MKMSGWYFAQQREPKIHSTAFRKLRAGLRNPLVRQDKLGVSDRVTRRPEGRWEVFIRQGLAIRRYRVLRMRRRRAFVRPKQAQPKH
jgi:hypothetical protein